MDLLHVAGLVLLIFALAVLWVTAVRLWSKDDSTQPELEIRDRPSASITQTSIRAGGKVSITLNNLRLEAQGNRIFVNGKEWGPLGSTEEGGGARNLPEPVILTVDKDGVVHGDIPGDLIVKCAPGTNLTFNGKIEGNVTAENGNIYAKNVGGSVVANGQVKCESVDGSVKSENDVQCANVGGSIKASGEVRCQNVGGSVTTEGNVTCGMVGGSVRAQGTVSRT